ncbi:citryl-CoA lyase [Salinispirillum marinum]|uniref:citrate synthase (unknown stereospecificity) n=2 Tax=Saccharospirillaceae TaxID=255527 RepID=A0ABV8BBC1_9GAMM
MKIGREVTPKSAICTSTADTITVRGKDLCSELIPNTSFTDYFYLLLTGQAPNDTTRKVLDATLVSIAEHGFVPSIQAARMTYAAAPDALQGAVAAGILGCGPVILGASQNAGELFHRIAQRVDAGEALDVVVKATVTEMRAARLPIPGYGHPLHKERDPRVDALFNVAREAGASLRYVEIAEAIEAAIPGIVGKELNLNVSAAIPAVLLGTDFPVTALRGIPILARTASLIAHLNEETTQPAGFALSYHASQAVEFTG